MWSAPTTTMLSGAPTSSSTQGMHAANEATRPPRQPFPRSTNFKRSPSNTDGWLLMWATNCCCTWSPLNPTTTITKAKCALFSCQRAWLTMDTPPSSSKGCGCCALSTSCEGADATRIPTPLRPVCSASNADGATEAMPSASKSCLDSARRLARVRTCHVSLCERFNTSTSPPSATGATREGCCTPEQGILGTLTNESGRACLMQGASAKMALSK
mmetsp:Transcript_82390/g.251785  ORF Transcript_82390/g.251785 Transcript_82390/m.251785 type:complete len:215 (+) Transcript_82390:1559-2203(+)